jgi:hypothetical protein
MKKQTKKQFEMELDETIDDCLDRMKREGYTPVRRIEKPIFKEVMVNGEIIQDVERQMVIFEGKLV